MQRNDVIVDMRADVEEGRLLELEDSAFLDFDNGVNFVLRIRAIASELRHSFITHLLKSKQFEIALMSSGLLTLEVWMEKSVFVAQQMSTQELVPEHLQDVIQALEFQDSSKHCLGILSILASVVWTGENIHGDVDGVSKFGSEEYAKCM